MAQPLLARLSQFAEYIVLPGVILTAYYVAHEPGGHAKKEDQKK